MPQLKPFWAYYGGKWRAAPHYPQPQHDVIIELFAGAAGYAMRYYDRRVILVEKYHVIAEMWRYLIGASEREVRAIPIVDCVDDLPAGLPQGAEWLVGFLMNNANTHPCVNLSAGLRRLQERGRTHSGWGEGMRDRIASQVDSIRHWEVIEGDYTEAPDIEATWFIDPPYNNKAGSYYAEQIADYRALGQWCQSRRGHVIVCENYGADWLPFRSFAMLKAGVNGAGSHEAIWTNQENSSQPAMNTARQRFNTERETMKHLKLLGKIELVAGKYGHKVPEAVEDAIDECEKKIASLTGKPFSFEATTTSTRERKNAA